MATKACLKKNLGDLFTKLPVPLPIPKKPFNQKPVPKPRFKKLAHSLINIYLTEMVKSDGEEMVKKRLCKKNTWYDWLINHIPKLIKTVGSAKEKFMSLFKTKLDYVFSSNSLV